VPDTGRIAGAGLTAHHGAPLRLVVPSFYGCASIKWVNRITVVDGGAMPPTSQMREFRGRIHMSKASKISAAGGWSAWMQRGAAAWRVER